jgi:hypothetical protein
MWGQQAPPVADLICEHTQTRATLSRPLGRAGTIRFHKADVTRTRVDARLTARLTVSKNVSKGVEKVLGEVMPV